MHKSILFILCFSMAFICYSNDTAIEKKSDYGRIFNQLICRLNVHPDNQKTKKKIQETYSHAIKYYQGEIDRILMSDNSLKWAKTLDVMEQINGLSEEIIYNSAVSELICTPRVYTIEIDDAKQKAVAELYTFGAELLTQNTKEMAKEAYFYFVKAGKLDPKFKDVEMKIQESKNRATWKVIIEPVQVHTQNYGLSFSTKIFYQTLFYKLREKFPYYGFVNFYSPEEALEKRIKNPDQTVLIEIFDFELVSIVETYGGEVISFPSKVLKLVDGKYVWEKYVGPPNNRISNQKTRSQLLMKANTALKISSIPDNEIVFKDKIPWNYKEEVNYSYKSGISQRYAPYSPDNQIFFDHFSLTLCDQVIFRLCDFFKPYNQ